MESRRLQLVPVSSPDQSFRGGRQLARLESHGIFKTFLAAGVANLSLRGLAQGSDDDTARNRVLAQLTKACSGWDIRRMNLFPTVLLFFPLPKRHEEPPVVENTSCSLVEAKKYHAIVRSQPLVQQAVLLRGAVALLLHQWLLLAEDVFHLVRSVLKLQRLAARGVTGSGDLPGDWEGPLDGEDGVVAPRSRRKRARSRRPIIDGAIGRGGNKAERFASEMAFDSLGESLGMSDPGREAKVSFYQEALNRLGQQYAGAGNYAAGAHSILELQLKNAAARQGYQHEEWSLPTQDALYTRDFWDDQGFDDCWEGYRRMVARGQPCRGVVGFERPRAVGTVPFHLTPHKWHLETTRSRDAGDPLLRTVTGADDEGFEPKDFGDFEEEEGVKTSDAGLRQQHDDDASELGKSRELDNNDVSPLDRLDRWGGPEDEDLMVTAQVGYDDNDENNDMHQNHLGEDMEVDKEGKDGKDSPTIRGEHSRKSPDVDTVVNMQPSPRTPGAREQKRARGRPRIKEHPTAPIRKVTWDRCGHSVMASFPPLVFFVSRETSERRQWHQFRKRLRLFKKDVDGLHGVAFVLASSAFLSPLQSEVHVDPRVGFLCSRLDNLNLTDELPESVARPAKLTTPTRRALRKGRSGKGDHDVSANPWHISWDEVTWPPTGVSVFQKPSVALDDSQNASYDIFSGGSSPQAAEDMWDPAAAGENRSSRSRSCDVGISRAAVSDIMSSSDYVEVLRGLFDSSSLTQGGVYPPYGTGGMTGTGTATTARHSSQILQQYYAGAPVLPSAEASSDRSDSRRHSFDKNEDAITSSSRRTSGSDEPLPQENGLGGRPHQGGQQQNLPGLSHPLAGHSESSMHTGANLSRGESADDRNSHLTTLGMTSSSLPSISADMGSYSDTWSGKEKDTTRAGFKSFLYALLRRQVAAGRAVSPDVNLFDDGAASTPAPAHGSRSGGEASGSIAYLPFSQIVPRGRVSTTTAARAFQHLLGLHSRGEITLQQKQVNINQVTDDYEGMTTTPHPLYITASTQEILLFNNQTFHPDIHGLTTLSCEASLHSDKHTLSRIMTRHHVSSPCNSGRVTESHHILVGA